VKESLLDYLVCPLCHSQLGLTIIERVDDVIETGSLYCHSCHHPFPIENGIPNMLSPQLPGIAEKLREVRGWVELSTKQGWYHAEERIDLALPYVVEELGWDLAEASSWAATKVSFEHMLAHYVRPGMRVLEVGAAKTWAGRYFNERGCEYTACDIMDDPNIGVGRSRFFIQRFGHYEAVVTDAEGLPFWDEYFDLVFAVAALHHAIDLPKMLNEMARVAKRGAIVAGLNEGVRAFRSSPDAAIQSEEKSFGINEHVHTLWEYYLAFLRNRLFVIEMTRAIGYDHLISQELGAQVGRLLRIPLVGKWCAAFVVLGLSHPYDGVTIFARRL
ncbi:MAG: methyltransferase domain-containing protein, partial [Chloroflexi bacterium]|nr:methyltransferase domain-containing protein [Chloroflexota bacterium]